jgi:hypothetical protein
MLYRFNEWGSPTSFMNARYLSVAYSLLTLALLFFIGMRIAGLWGGAIAGALWALDGRVVEINRKVMLDTPMVLFACAAVALYLWAWSGGPRSIGSSKRWMLAGAGVFATLAALTKITGIAVLLAIMADLLWQALEQRRTLDADRPMEDASFTINSQSLSPRRSLLLVVSGAVAAGLLVVIPFLFIAPSEFLRQVFFFQILRPSDGITEVPARIADLTATLANSLTPLFAVLGVILASLHIWLRRDRHSETQREPSLSVAEGTLVPEGTLSLKGTLTQHFRLIALWTFFNLLLFTYSRSFYPHYYVQLAAPLCITGAGVALLGRGLKWKSHASGITHQVSRALPIVIVIALAVPLAATAWSGIITRSEDRIFEIVARYANDAVPPGTAVLTTDEQFNLLAARPPSHNATGYLVDSYGHMIYLGMGIPSRDWGVLFSDLFTGQRSNDAYAAMDQSLPQSDFVDRASRARLIVIHDRGFARLTDATLAQIESLADREVEEARYTIYRGR